MKTILVILLCVGVLILCVYYLFYTFKRNAYVNKILKSYPNQVEALCRIDLKYNRLTPTAKKKIISCDKSSWEDWKIKVSNLKSLSAKFPEVISNYILFYFPYVKEVKLYRQQDIFVRKGKLCQTLIDCLLYDDILKLNQISSEEWTHLNETLEKAKSIELSNPDAIRELRKKEPNLTESDIINHQKHIEQIQQRFAIASAFDAWLPSQKEFNSLARDLRNDYAQNCGCYYYDVEFMKPLSSGKISAVKTRVWQIFPESFSPYLKEFQSSLSFSMTPYIPEFEACQRFYNNDMYEKIIPYITAIAKDKKILIVFNNHTSYNWDIQTYEYHYKYFKSILNSHELAYCDLDNLSTKLDSFDFDVVFVFDFITVNTDLIYTTKLIIESFSTKIPNIVWYSMIKEYDESEMKSLCANAIKEQEKKKDETVLKSKEKHNLDDIVKSKTKSIFFIKEQLQRMNKASRFSIFAVTNTLIGNAVNSHNVKQIWMSDPDKIQMTSSSSTVVKREGYITVKYSIDRGQTWQIFEMQGEYDNIDDVSNFTYELFKKVGVISNFIQFGALAIDYMNNNRYLKS